MYKFPEYVMMDECTAMVLDGHEYYRVGGHWSCRYKLVDGELLSVDIYGMPHLNDRPLRAITKEEHDNDNGQYAKDAPAPRQPETMPDGNWEYVHVPVEAEDDEPKSKGWCSLCSDPDSPVLNDHIYIYYISTCNHVVIYDRSFPRSCFDDAIRKIQEWKYKYKKDAFFTIGKPFKGALS